MRVLSRLAFAAAVCFLASAAAAAAPAPTDATRNFSGDTQKAAVVWSRFESWLAAYRRADLAGTMAIFEPDVRFLFQGQKDQGYAELEAGYRSDFAKRTPDAKKEWVPSVEEIYAEGSTAFVRSVWEARVSAADGSIAIKARNRSIDVFRLGKDGDWRIFRSLNYPEKDR